MLGLTLALWAPCAQSQVRVIRGPTPIPGGDARASGDITVLNDRVAFALAVQSPPPYGVPRGALVDLAPVHGGTIGHDRVIFADFIPNNWSAWPNHHQQVTVLKDTPAEAVIEAVRDWGAVKIDTLYELKAGDDRVHIRVTMTNGGTVILAGLRSGMTLWPSAGYFLGVPGLAGIEDGSAAGALADWTAAYDEDWAIALHAPYADHIGFGGRDMDQAHSLAPGQSRSFEAWLQVTASGDLAPMVADEIARRRLAAGTLSGKVTGADARPIAGAVVVIEKSGKPFAWTVGDADGRYRIVLPVGDYAAFAAGEAMSQSPPQPVTMTSGSSVSRDFSGLQPPGTVHFVVTRKGSGVPLDARIAIDKGQKPLVEYLGRRVFFTALDRRGEADLTLAPGDYSFSVSHGQDVLAPVAAVTTTVVSGQATSIAVPLSVPFDPEARGWYSADLHHHADQAEAVTPAPDLARSQLAAGLDLLFVSDHDSTANFKPLQAIADARGIAFIPGIEISTSWAHFNAYPLDPDAHLAIDTSDTNVGAVFAEARRMGAGVVQVNHPFIPYGYFTSVKAGVAPGGFDPAFDLLEINAHNAEDDDKVLKAAWDSWNAGRAVYLAAGTDVHDVWNELSGKVRTFAHVETGAGPLTAQSFTRALKAGHAYVTYGPLVFPDHMFGDTIRAAAGGHFALGSDLQAVGGLKRVSLISRGAIVKTIDLSSSDRTAHVEFPLIASGATWYSLIVEDAGGRRAYTDPIWISPR